VKYTPRLPVSEVNATPHSPLKEFVLLAGALTGIAVGVYLVLGLAIDLVVPRLSVDFEKKLAGAFLSALESKPGRTEHEQWVQALTDRLQTRCAGLPYRLKIHVQESPAVNALALPGGHVVVFSGLLKTVSSENELAFILAHEMGHFQNRDHLRGAGRALVVMTISAALFGPNSGISAALGQILNLTELSFSRGQETAADEFGLDVLQCAYGHVAGASDFFRKIPTSQDPGRFGHYFASHPENRRRISHLEALIGQKGYATGDKKPLGDLTKTP
jgi:Zn-dependent protease with chaperone function